MMLLLDCYDAAMLLDCRGDANPAVNKREQVKEFITSISVSPLERISLLKSQQRVLITNASLWKS